MRTTFLPPKAPRVSPSFGRRPRFSFSLARGHSPTCGGPWPPRVLPPHSLLDPSLPTATAPGSSSYIAGLSFSCLRFRNHHHYTHVTTISTRGQPIASFTHPATKVKQKLLISPVATPQPMSDRNNNRFHQQCPYHHPLPSPPIITSTSNP